MKYGFVIFFIFLSGCSTVNQELPQENSTTDIKKEEVSLISSPNLEAPMLDTECVLFDNFSNTEDYRWGIVNDGVMGGKSQGKAQILDETLVFSGTLVTRGGGFSSLRAGLDSGVLSEYNSVKLRAKSDGREYRITFRDNRWGNISHRTIIPFQTPGELEDIEIVFTDLIPAYFGRQVDTESFNKDTAREIGVILSDGVDGEFELVIDEVRFCK